MEICRICLNAPNDTPTMSIFINEGAINLATMIMECASINICKTDNFPHQICGECERQLRAAYNFRVMCRKSDDKLRQEYRDDQSLSGDSIGVVDTRLQPESEAKSDGVAGGAHTCPICCKVCATRSNLNEHLITHTTARNYQCPVCHKRLRRAQTLKQHVRLHTATRDFTCEVCGNAYISISVLKNHRKTHHERVEPATGTTLRQYLCDVCGCVKKTATDLRQHMHTHTGARPYSCTLCADKQFRNKGTLRVHIQQHHRNGTTPLVDPHQCLFCDKTFRTRTHLRIHTRTIHTPADKKYACSVCGKKFRTARTHNNHVKIHTGERNYPCTECPKAFVNRFDLKRHQARHARPINSTGMGVTPTAIATALRHHQCETCGKVYGSGSDLRKHQRSVHATERPHECQHLVNGAGCGKRFSTSSALAVHVRTHTGAKPYACQVCGRTFAQSSNLRIHIRAVHKHSPNGGPMATASLHTCPVCNRTFNRRRDLQTHLKKHTIQPTIPTDNSTL